MPKTITSTTNEIKSAQRPGSMSHSSGRRDGGCIRWAGSFRGRTGCRDGCCGVRRRRGNRFR